MKCILVNRRLVGFLCALTAALTFAASLVMARISYDYGVDPQTVMVTRFALLSLLMLGWNRIRHQSMRLPLRTIAACFGIGMTYFIGIGAYLSSVAYLPVSLAVLIFYTFPVLVALASAALERRWPRPLEFGALLTAFIGLVIALDVQLSGFSWVGLLLALCASLGVTCNMLASSHVLKSVPTTVFSLYLATATLLLSSLAILLGHGFAWPGAREGWLAFGAMLVCFLIGFLCTYTSLRLIGAVRLSTVMNIEPVATILLAVLLLDEILQGRQFIGGIVVLVAVLSAQWQKIRQILTGTEIVAEHIRRY